MAHKLLQNVFWAGTEYGPGLPAGASIPGLPLDAEAQLVTSNRAVYTSPPSVINPGVPVLADSNPLTGGNEIIGPDGVPIYPRVTLIPLSDYLNGQVMPNDGVRDAAPLFNAAMNDLLLKANSDPRPYGQICYVLDLGPGLFRTTANIQPGGVSPTSQNQHVGIRGAGMNQTFILPEGPVSGIIFNQVTSSLPSAVDCHFSDFTVDLKNATLGPGGASRKGFIGRGWFDCTWTRVAVLNSPATAFGVDFPVRCKFTDCHVVKTGLGVNGELDMPNGVIDAAQYHSGFGFGFGVFDDESVSFIGCTATDCYRGGFFFESFEASSGNTKRGAVISMIGCRSSNNRIGISNVGAGGVTATNCEITDNTVAGYYGGVSGGTTVIASLNTTLENCNILRNAYGIYATGDFSGAGHKYTALRSVLGGYRILDCRIEDNTLGALVAERFKGIEAGGLVIRGNSIRHNLGGAAITMRDAADPLRDVVITDNYFDSNTNTGISLLVPMIAPDISRNTFVNSDGGSLQTTGIALHVAEPISKPRIGENTYRQITTPMVNVSRLGLTNTGDRILNSTDDSLTPWTYREIFYGGANTAWPVGGDGWAKNTAGSSSDWMRFPTGVAKGGAGTAISYIYRDFGTSGIYVEARITSTTDIAELSQFIGVMLSMASASVRTSIIAGVNGAGIGQALTSNFYAVWKVVGSTYTLLWESTVPMSEAHSIALARETGSTVTDVYIDGVLVHTLDVTDVAPTALGGFASVIVTNQKRLISEFRAMPYAIP